MSAAPTTFRSPEALRAAVALSLVERVGPVHFHEKVATFGSAARALDALPATVRRVACENADTALADAERCGAAAVPHDDPRYPRALLDLRDAPPVLWTLGCWPPADAPVVAIVGTRDATDYGERATRSLCRAFVEAGAVVASGMAIGIDAAAHRAALEAGGHTIAVLGTGVDVPYPVGHRGLHREIAERGLLLSELPPGTRARAGSFPRRNRLIAALASLTVVVEAGVKSGALITANDAAELGRTVAAVPGPIDSPHSAGSNQLLRDGAQVLASPDDALALVGLGPRPEPATPLDAAQGAVWRALGAGALLPDALVALTGLPARECLVAVTALELAGLVEGTPAGAICRRR